MPSKSSDNKLLLNLSKYLSSPGYQPESITAAGETNPAPLTVHHSGSIAVDECVQAYNEAFRQTLEKEKNEYNARKAGTCGVPQTLPSARAGSRFPSVPIDT